MTHRTTDEILASNRELVDRLDKPHRESLLSKVNKLGFSYIWRSLAVLLVYETLDVQGLVYIGVFGGVIVGLTILAAGYRMGREAPQ